MNEKAAREYALNEVALIPDKVNAITKGDLGNGTKEGEQDE